MRTIRVGYRTRPLPEWVGPGWTPGRAFDMTESARAFHASPARIRVLRGGLQSAKSHTLTRGALFAAFENLGSRGLVVEPDYPLLRDVWQPRWEEALDECGLVEGTDWAFNKNEQRYDCLGGWTRGGFSVLLKSGGAFSKIVGFETSWAVIDEPAEMPREALTRVMYRTRLNDRLIMIGGTPDPGSWFADWLRDPGLPEDEVEVIQARTLDNPYTRPGYVESVLAECDAQTARAMLEGEVVTIGGGAYPDWSEEWWPKGNLSPDEYDHALPLWIALDNNRDPLVAALLQERGERLHQFDEVMLQPGGWAELAERIAVKLKGETPAGIFLAGDAVLRGQVVDEQTDWGGYIDVEQQLRRVLPHSVRVQLRVPKGNPLVILRVQAMNAAICDAAGRRRYTCHPRCEETRADWKFMQQDTDGQLIKPGRTTKGRKVSPKRSHLSDAVGYLEHVRNPPKRFVRHRTLIAGLPR